MRLFNSINVMAKRKTKSKIKKTNSFTIFIIVVVILALASFAISYFVMQTESEIVASSDLPSEATQIPETDTKVETETKPDEQSYSQILVGTWASNNDGAMLTITDNKFTIELPSVQSSIIASGNIKIVDNTITFIYTNEKSTCGDTPGIYKFSIVDDEVTFDKINDSCGIRSEQIVATWFKV